MTVDQYNKSVDLYADAVYRFMLKNIRQPDEAKDIVQDTYEKLWVRAADVSFEKVKAYLFSTAYHTMIDKIRKNKRISSVEEYGGLDPLHDEQYSDLNEVLHEALNKLPNIQRSVILLRDYEGYSYQEIAEITGLSESQVKVYIYRGRRALKEYIGSIEVIL
ncbi:MAG: RNA polymerase sigma factor [Bacteroidales bacterium]|jgi:RNA polymerase sigma-70 factor (ECF subfamily)|nr:RNA polymerase sigma factor [Bacteroidales bacterium]